MRKLIYLLIFCWALIPSRALGLGEKDVQSGMQTGFAHWYFRAETPQQQAEAFKVLADNGVRYIHGEVLWDNTEKAPGQFDFSRYETAFSLMRKYGLKIYLTLGGGVNGQTTVFPDFYIGKGWRIERGGGTGNSVNFLPAEEAVELNYHKDKLWLSWPSQISRKIRINPRERVNYTIRLKWVSGDNRISVGYKLNKLRGRAKSNRYEESAKLKVPKDGKWHTYNLKIDAPYFDPAANYLQFKLGINSRSPSKILFSLKDYKIARKSGMVDTSSFTKAFQRVRCAYNAANGEVAIQEHGGITYVVFTDEDLKAKEERWMRAALRWIKKNYPDLVIAMGPNNEPWGSQPAPLVIDYSELNRKAFSRWLRAKYLQIDELNRSWSQTKIRRYNYRAFDEIEIPKVPEKSGRLSRSAFAAVDSTPSAWVDFQEFMRNEYIFGYLNSRLKIIKEEIPQMPTYIKLPPRTPSFWKAAPESASSPLSTPLNQADAIKAISDCAALFAASPYVDILGIDFYGPDSTFIKTTFATVATIAKRYGKSWAVFEIGIDIWGQWANVRTAEMMRYAAAYGPKVIFAYKLVAFLGQESGYYSLGVGPRQPAFRAVVKAIKELEGKQVQIPDAEVAILYSGYLTYYRGNVTPVHRTQDALADLGIKTTLVYDYEVRENPEILNQFKAVLLPYARILRRDPNDITILKAVNDYIAGGGRVFFEAVYDDVTSTLEPVGDTHRVLTNLPAKVASIDRQGKAIAVSTSHPILAYLSPSRRSRIETVPGEGQVHFQLRAKAKVLAEYKQTRDPAMVLSADERVLMIGPLLRPRERLELFRGLFSYWKLIPLQVRGEGIYAHLGKDGLAIANESGQRQKFEVVIPFKAVPMDYAQYKIKGGQTLISGQLDARKVIFTRLKFKER